jgi:alkylhydroperoxidase family enzyme
MGHVHYSAAVAGLSDTSHFADLERGEGLDPRRRLALPFARKLTRAPDTVGRADIEALRAEFTDEEIVNLVFAVCHYNTMNRLAHAFGVPLERTNPFTRRPAARPPSGEEPAEGEPAP